MLKALIDFLLNRKGHAPEAQETPAPYKVETPAVTPIMVPPVVEPVKCGCGRSATGYCVGLHKLTPDEWAAHPDNPVKPEAAPKKPAAKKPRAPAKKKTETAPKAAAEKKPRQPRAKKTS